IEAARQVAPGVGAITLWYRDPERKHVMLYARHVGVAQPELLSSGPADAQSPVLKVMEHSTPLFVVDLYAHPILGGDFIVHEQIVSVAALPLVADDETVGALFFNYRARHTFTSEECALFQTMAAVAAASVRDALRLEALKRERQRLERERQRLDVARRITEAIGTTIDLNQTQIKVLGTLREIFEEAQICLMLYDTEEQALRFAPTSHQYYNFELIDPLQPLRVFAEQGIVCRVARITLKSKRAEVENIGNVAADPNYLKANRSTQSQLCVSLVSVDQGDLLGLLVLESTSPDAFSDDDKALVWAAAQSIAIAIERANQSSRLRFKASVADATVWIHEFRHNINSAISIIRGQAYLVQPVVPVTYQLHLEKIVAQAEQINAYLRASGAQGKLALSLDEWLAAQLVATKLPSRISRHFVSGCPGVHVEVVPLLLERVLHHLLRNVVESTSGAVDVTLTSERLSQYARVRVHNTGPDLDPAILSRLWIEPVSTKSNQRQGIEGGLGLLFVRSSVEMMGGTVNLLRSHGQGVTFTFTLPIVRQTTLEEV
ncbi:MAG: GAF domain-containing protein, partial [Oscillochloris sp.]|nr:GAF domain-containing protein [Oscillochloris sp.]